jgi:hypothetical protein
VSVELVLVEALPVRRAYTSVRDVAMRTLDLVGNARRYARRRDDVHDGAAAPAGHTGAGLDPVLMEAVGPLTAS